MLNLQDSVIGCPLEDIRSWLLLKKTEMTTPSAALNFIMVGLSFYVGKAKFYSVTNLRINIGHRSEAGLPSYLCPTPIKIPLKASTLRGKRWREHISLHSWPTLFGKSFPAQREVWHLKFRNMFFYYPTSDFASVRNMVRSTKKE